MTLYVCRSHPGLEQLTVNGMKWCTGGVGVRGASITTVVCKLEKAVKSLAGNKTF